MLGLTALPPTRRAATSCFASGPTATTLLCCLCHVLPITRPTAPTAVGNGKLSPGEQRAHFALWAVMKSPLLVGADLRSIHPDSLAILKAKVGWLGARSRPACNALHCTVPHRICALA